jgi:multiple sugar transport system permease protein
MLNAISTRTDRNRQRDKPTRRRVFAGGMRSRRLLVAYALVAPVVLWRLATSVYPFGYTIYLSFFDHNPMRRSHEFIGLENYQAMFQDPSIRTTIEFTIFFTVLSVALQVILGLAIAQLLNRQFHLRNLVRAVNLLPWAMSAIVAGVAAGWIFNQDYGLINDLIWRLTGARPMWLSDVLNARIAVALADVWKNTPFLVVVFLSGLQGISRELYEAAKLDGASAWRAFWSITLPLLMPLIISMAIFVAIFRVLSFELVYAMTEGGPGSATSLMSYQVYLKAFRLLDFGYASALAMGLVGMVLVVGIVGFVLLRRTWSKLY